MYHHVVDNYVSLPKHEVICLKIPVHYDKKNVFYLYSKFLAIEDNRSQDVILF